jgi:hypothetical protein
VAVEPLERHNLAIEKFREYSTRRDDGARVPRLLAHGRGRFGRSFNSISGAGAGIWRHMFRAACAAGTQAPGIIFLDHNFTSHE